MSLSIHGRGSFKSNKKDSQCHSTFSKKIGRMGARALMNAPERVGFTALTGLAGICFIQANINNDGLEDAPKVLALSGLVGGVLFGAAKGVFHILEDKEPDLSAPRPTVLGTMGESVLCGVIGYTVISSVFKIKTPIDFVIAHYLIGGAATGYLAHLGNWKID